MSQVPSAFDAVREELRYAYANVPFFRAHMQKAGLVPEDIASPMQLQRIPITRKADYRRNFPAAVLASGFTLGSRHVMSFRSSGTEGERLTSAVLSYDLARRQATCLEFNPRFEMLWRPGLKLRTCRFAAPNCSEVECSTPFATMQSRILADRTLVLPVNHDLLTTPAEMTNRALDEIAEYDPHLLFVDPTHFAFLIRGMRASGRQPHRCKGFCIGSGYTLCTQVARRQIRECYGDEVPFANMLGMSEFGYLGLECPAGQLHLNDRDYYVEFMHGDRPAVPGELSELILTTLEDRLSPHIRYATGDFYRVKSEACGCGSPAPVVVAEGRGRNMIRLSDGTMRTPRELDEIVGPAPGLDLYRLSQLDLDQFRFEFLPNGSWSDEDERDLGGRLGQALRSANLVCSAVSYLPSERGGKFQSCVSKVSDRMS